MNEYKPGTVAKVLYRDHGRYVTAVFTETGHWVAPALKPYHPANDHPSNVRDIRPLVVLDLDCPPNEAVENLRYVAREYDARMRHEGYMGRKPPSNARLLLRLVDQIEQQTQPPRPEEPSEFGARVTALASSAGRRPLIRIYGDIWQAPNGDEFVWDELSDVTLGWDDEGSGT